MIKAFHMALLSVNKLINLIFGGNKEKPSYPWIVKAQSQLGVKELPGEVHTRAILDYHQATTLKATSDEVPWCAAFVSWCLEKRGLYSARALDYAHLGTELSEPWYGCIAVFKRVGGGHVGFYVGEEPGRVLVLGGNQNNSVCVMDYPKSQLVCYRWPPDFPLPHKK